MDQTYRDPAVCKKLVDNLQTDLRTLSADSKRKYPPVKEVCFKLYTLLYAE